MLIFINHYVMIAPPLDPFSPGDWSPQDMKVERCTLKLGVVVEQAQITTLWTIKICFLVAYSRFTEVKYRTLLFNKIQQKSNTTMVPIFEKITSPRSREPTLLLAGWLWRYYF
jgi:hypothetical protein